jgi:hypothetical protein
MTPEKTTIRTICPREIPMILTSGRIPACTASKLNPSQTELTKI